MSTPIIDTIVSAVKAANISTAQVQFPMTYTGKTDDQDRPIFHFANDVDFPMLEIGAGYLHERFKATPYSAFTKLFRDAKFEFMSTYTTQSADVMVAALYEGAIVGLMSNYVPVPHKELLDMIKDAGLADRIIHWNLSVTGLRVDISLRSAVEETRNKLIAALSIDNGHSGHYALRYRAAVRVDDFEWRLPLSGKRRHLSKVHLAVANFSASLDQVQDLRIEDKLKAMTMGEVDAILVGVVTTVRQERLVIQVRDTKPANASEFVASMGVYASTLGYSSAVHGLLNPILDAATKV